MSKQPPPAPTASTIGPCPTVFQVSRTPRHWKFTQHLRTTRPPLYCRCNFIIIAVGAAVFVALVVFTSFMITASEAGNIRQLTELLS